MSTKESRISGPTATQNGSNHRLFDSDTGIYRSAHETLATIPRNPNNHRHDTAAFVLSQFPPPHRGDSLTALINSASGQRVTYTGLRRSVLSLARGLRFSLGISKNDVVFVLSPNSLLYPTICLAVLSVGAVLTTANPLNSEPEIAKQVLDSGPKLAITAPEALHKLVPTGVRTILTSRSSSHGGLLSVEELIEGCEPAELDTDTDTDRPSPDDTAAILYSSGTTGTSKGVVLTHENLVSLMRLLKWSVNATKAQNDVFLCLVPMFHVYGLAFFVLGLFCCGTTTVVMSRFEFGAMLDAIRAYGVSNIPAVPAVVLGMVRFAGKGGRAEFAGVRRVGSGAAPLSKEVADEFRLRLPWIELRPGYGLTESCGAATLFISDQDAKPRPGSSGGLLPGFYAKIVDIETGKPLPPYKEGELWIKSSTVMKEYLRKPDATAATISEDGWLRTGDLCCFDDQGFLYVVDRIKELIKYNGYQVAPAELEAILLGHPDILDTAVIPVEDKEAGEIPMAYVVRASGTNLTKAQVMQYVARQVAPYKKVRRVSFINAIPRSSAGKILRKDLILQSKQEIASRL